MSLSKRSRISPVSLGPSQAPEHMESLRVDRWLSWLKIQKDVQLVAKEAEPHGRNQTADR